MRVANFREQRSDLQQIINSNNNSTGLASLVEEVSLNQ